MPSHRIKPNLKRPSFRRTVDLAEEHGPVSCLAETDLDSSDSRKESDDVERPLRSTRFTASS